MGTWGHETFANETAVDWSRGLAEVDDLSWVVDAIDAVMDGEADDVVEADLGRDALAACEVIARLRGNWGRRDAYSGTADRWVEAHPQPVPPRLVRRAAKAIERVLGEASELRDLWHAGRAGGDWTAAVEDLRRRVEG